MLRRSRDGRNNKPARGTPTTIAAAAIARGERAIGAPSSDARPRVEADGHLVVDRGEVAQHCATVAKASR